MEGHQYPLEIKRLPPITEEQVFIQRRLLERGFNIDSYTLLEMEYKHYASQAWKAIDGKAQRFATLKLFDKTKFTIEIQEQERKKKKLSLLRLQGLAGILCNSFHVVKYYEIYENENHILFAMEYCNEGTLDKYLQQQDSLDEQQSLDILKQIIYGIIAIDKLNIGLFPLDLTPANIVKHNSIYKIANFGFYLNFQQYKKQKYYTRLGIATTLAPQILNGKQFSSKAIVWSLGVLYFLMICSKIKEKQDFYPNLPYSYRHYKILQYAESKMFEILQKNEENKINENSANFLISSLSISTKTRANWKQLVSSPLLKNFKFPQQLLLKDNKPLSQRIQIVRAYLLNVKENNNEILTKKIKSQKINQKIGKIETKERQIKIKQDQKITQIQICVWIYKNILKISRLPQCSTFRELEREKRTYIQLMYLISSRVYCSISNIKQKIKQYPKLHEFYEQHNIELSYENIKQVFKIYRKKLTSRENQIKYMFIDKVKPNQIHQKAKNYLQGIIGMDFTQQKQINITKDLYIKWLFEHCKKPSKYEKQILGYLDKYVEINHINAQMLKNIKFQKVIEHILNKNKQN